MFAVSSSDLQRGIHISDFYKATKYDIYPLSSLPIPLSLPKAVWAFPSLLFTSLKPPILNHFLCFPGSLHLPIPATQF